MPERHATRGAQTRAAEKRELLYVPPNQLDAPKAKPGIVHRWVRVSLMGVDDDKNLSLRRREGWEPVRQEEHPEFLGSVHSEGRFSGVVGVGDLILMKWTEEGLAAKRRYVESKTDRLQSALDSSLFREQDPRMPITVDRKSRVSTGGGLQFDE
jgi:hypothetical protein